MKLKYLIVTALLLGLAAGCAPVQPEEIQDIKSRVLRNQRNIEQVSAQIGTSRKPQAELKAELVSLRQDFAKLRGNLEEVNYRLNQLPNADDLSKAQAEAETNAGKSLKKDYKALKNELFLNTRTLSRLKKRIAALESYLGIKQGASGKASAVKARTKKGKAKKVQKARPAASQKVKPKGKTKLKVTTDKTKYDEAHQLVKKKAYGKARAVFAELIKKWPNSKLAAPARFWIGECYYLEKDYAEAVLSYNRVIKKYPKSNKVSSALLKQGLAFKELGDKVAAGIVFKKLIKDFPKSEQAKAARKLLDRMN
jgi:tol-pal system protein YbgF